MSHKVKPLSGIIIQHVYIFFLPGKLKCLLNSTLIQEIIQNINYMGFGAIQIRYMEVFIQFNPWFSIKIVFTGNKYQNEGLWARLFSHCDVFIYTSKNLSSKTLQVHWLMTICAITSPYPHLPQSSSHLAFLSVTFPSLASCHQLGWQHFHVRTQ